MSRHKLSWRTRNWCCRQSRGRGVSQVILHCDKYFFDFVSSALPICWVDGQETGVSSNQGGGEYPKQSDSQRGIWDGRGGGRLIPSISPSSSLVEYIHRDPQTQVSPLSFLSCPFVQPARPITLSNWPCHWSHLGKLSRPLEHDTTIITDNNRELHNRWTQKLA